MEPFIRVAFEFLKTVMNIVDETIRGVFYAAYTIASCALILVIAGLVLSYLCIRCVSGAAEDSPDVGYSIENLAVATGCVIIAFAAYKKIV